MFFDWFTHAGSRAPEHCMINEPMQLKIPPPLKKPQALAKQVWALELLRQMV